MHFLNWCCLKYIFFVKNEFTISPFVMIKLMKNNSDWVVGYQLIMNITSQFNYFKIKVTLVVWCWLLKSSWSNPLPKTVLWWLAIKIMIWGSRLAWEVFSTHLIQIMLIKTVFFISLPHSLLLSMYMGEWVV